MQLFLGLLVSLLSVSVHAESCGCSSKEKTTTLKEVQSREGQFITARDGSPLMATFWDTSSTTKTTATKPSDTPANPKTAATNSATIATAATTAPVFKIEFATNAQKPNSGSLEQVAAIKKMLKNGNYKSVQVLGFTDSTGSEDYNQKLSLARAQEIRNMLINAVPKNTTLTATGRGVMETPDLDKARVVEVQLVR